MILLGCLLGVYLCLFFTDIYGPGLAYEELDETMFTVDILHNRPASGATCTIPFGKTSLPLTATTPYMGAIQTYLLLPFFQLFGVNVFALRFMSIVFGIGTLLFTFYFLRTFFNRLVAFLTIFFLILQPSFLLFTKMGYSDSILNLFFAALLLLFAKYYAKRKSAYLYLFAFIAGVGLWTKIVFIWAILGFFVSWLILYRRDMRVSFRQFLFSLALFGLGVAPLAYANFALGGSTVQKIATALHGAYYHDHNTYVNNYEFINNISKRIHQFLGMYSGYDFDVFYPYGSLKVITIFPFLFLCALIALSLLAFKYKKQLYGKHTMFIMLLFTILFLGLCFTVSIFRPKHLLFLAPLPEIILSLFIVHLFNFLKRLSSVITFAVSIFMVGLVILPNITIINWYRSKNFTVSAYDNSMVTYELTEYMLRRGINTIYIVDEFCRMGRKISFLSNEKIDVRELIRPGGIIPTPDEFYVLTFPVTNVGPSSESNYTTWDRFIKNQSLGVIPVMVFADSVGRPIYILSKVNMQVQ